MATKHQYGKAKGVFFKQYVQSFKPDCNAIPEQIHRIGLETAKLFDGFEVVVAHTLTAITGIITSLLIRLTVKRDIRSKLMKKDWKRYGISRI